MVKLGLRFVLLLVSFIAVSCRLKGSDPSPAVTFLRNEHLNGLKAILRDLASVLSAPTHVTRKMYMYSMASSTAWVAVSGKRRERVKADGGFPTRAAISGVHDYWNFDEGTVLSDRDATVFVNHAIIDFLSSGFSPSFNASAALAREREFFGWDEEEQNHRVETARDKGNWSSFKTKWNLWQALRESDGWNTTAAYAPTVEDIPSIATPLVTTSSEDPGNSGIWRPITNEFGSTQKYLGYKWYEVRTTALTPDDETAILDTVSAYFPTEEQREEEIREVYEMTMVLTEHQKMMAEFWAGGPYTTSPPGQFGWLWSDYVSRFLPTGHLSYLAEADVQFLSFLDLAIHLFEGSRVTWRAKTKYLQSRPIQEIRNRYRGEVNPGFTGEDEPAELWMPYQTISFVTPPFGDFPSGHSHFSKQFQNVMTYWFGPNINADKLPVTYKKHDDLDVLCPSFVGLEEETGSMFGHFVFPAGSSEIQAGVVPSEDLEVTWDSWYELSESVGMSRLFGGIHAITAHTGSKASADHLHGVLQESWSIRNTKRDE